MSSVPRQTSLHQVNASFEAAMNVSEGTVTSQLRTTSRTYFCFITVTLVVCLIFSLATIMVLVVQKKEPLPQSSDKFDPIKGENCSSDILRILKEPLMTESSAYLQVSKSINSSKLNWDKEGILNGIGYHDGNLIIQSPGLYVIYCQLQFIVQDCPNKPIDLKLELLINNQSKKQTMVTVCESKTGTKKIYKNLSQFFLKYLDVNSTVSIKVEEFQYVDIDTLPLDSVLAAFKYSRNCY